MLEKLALKKKLITKKQCDAAMDSCRGSDQYENALKNYFIENNLIAEKTLYQLIKASNTIKIMRHTHKFGAVAIKMGLIDNKILEATLNKQKKSAQKNKRPTVIGKILVASGILTAEQVQSVVLEQKKMNLTIKTSAKDKPENNKKTEKPIISEIIMGSILLEVDNTGMAAYITKQKNFDKTTFVEDIISALMSKNIVFGIENSKNIQRFISSSGFKKNPFKVAQGIEEKVGTDAKIEYYFETDYLEAGGVDAEGNIDFKDRGQVPKVEEETLLAKKYPSTEPKHGRNIYGEELIVSEVKDIQLTIQSGCQLSQDGMEIYSEISGHPKLSKALDVSVVDTLLIKGDINYETGHIDFDGHISAKGCLKNGFKINGNNIQIGAIDGGAVHAEGSVKILNGVNGATIYSRGSIFAKFIHDSKIHCLGNVYVENEIVDSKIESSGACIIEKGEIINCKIVSNQGVIVKNLGTQKTHPNIIKAGQDAFINHEFKKIGKNILLNTNEINKIENKKKTLSTNNENTQNDTAHKSFELENALNKQAQIINNLSLLEGKSDKKKDIKKLDYELNKVKSLIVKIETEMNDYLDWLEIFSNRFFEFDEKIIALNNEILTLSDEKLLFTQWGKSNPGKTIVKISGRIFSGTVIHGQHSKKETVENLDNVTIKELQCDQNTPGKEYYEIYIQESSRRR